jgi:hypothetical protein
VFLILVTHGANMKIKRSFPSKVFFVGRLDFLTNLPNPLNVGYTHTCVRVRSFLLFLSRHK